MPQQYPFSAVVGADDMALALILTTISPGVGGVLVRGEKGTAKSTMVRALASVLPPIDVIRHDRFSTDPRETRPLSPDGPFGADAETETRPVRLIELPVGATEDRVLGSLHLEKALSEGITAYEPGLLARAHRGILYVDEVNLLHDHLVDLLLDAAAMGRSTVERDGISVEHAAEFVLIGTMNPEEGELRPQLLDRFGLTVEVTAPRDAQQRVDVIKRRLAFDRDPDAFADSYSNNEAELTTRIQSAQKLIEQLDLSAWALGKIAEVCAAFDVDGMRADIVTARAAAAHAAWHGRLDVTREDIRVAARLALPHRRRRNPFDAPGIDEDLLDQILNDDGPEPTPPDDGSTDDGGDDADAGNTDSADADSGDDSAQQPLDTSQHTAEHGDSPENHSAEGDAEPEPNPADHSAEGPSDPGDGTDAGQQPDAAADGDTPTSLVSALDPYRARLFTVQGTGMGDAGRRSRAIAANGRRIGAERPTERGGSIHLVETIKAAAPHQAVRRQPAAIDRRLMFAAADLRVAVKEGRESNLVLFCVDASGSMAARKRMEQVKTAILSLLLDAYQRRDKVGLVTFRGSEANLDLPPTSSVDIAASRLDDLPAGGRTPLAEGLLGAAETLRIERLRDARRRPLLVVVTDGRATYGTDPVARSQQAAQYLTQSGIASIVVDCETGRFRLGLASTLAHHLAAEYISLGEVNADDLTSITRQRLNPANPAHYQEEVA